MRKLWDWPQTLVPTRAIVIAPSNTIDSVISRGGYVNNLPVVGARNQVRMEFAARAERGGNDLGSLYAWALNQARGALFRVQAWNTPQLASSTDIKAKEAQLSRGIPFSTGERFSTGYGFKYVPTVDLVEDAAKGATTVKLDVTRHPNALTYGKVFGLGLNCYHVDDIALDGTIATIECRPALVRAYTVAIDKIVTLRPHVICTPDDIESFIALFEPAQIFRPGSITLNEVIDERFL